MELSATIHPPLPDLEALWQLTSVSVDIECPLLSVELVSIICSGVDTLQCVNVCVNIVMVHVYKL